VDATKRANRIKAVLDSMLVFVDIVMLLLAFVSGYYMRAAFVDPSVAIPPFERYLPTMFLHTIVIVMVLYFSQMYHQRRTFSRIDLFRKMFGSVTIGAVLVFGMQDLIFRGTALEVDYPRSMFFLAWVFSVFFVFSGRESQRTLLWNLRRRNMARDNLLIVGTGRIARDLMQKIQSKPELGYNIVGVVNSEIKPKGKVMGVPFVGLYDDLPQLIDTYQVEQVIIALPDAKRNEIAHLVTLCQRGRVDIKVYPDMFAYMAGDLNVDDLGGTPLLTVRDIALRGWRLSVKRALDVVVSTLGLIFLSPLMLLTALLIRLESPGPIFYTQIRMGLDGKPFPMIKFRSMRSDAEVSGPGWTVAGDPRVTRIGSIMRKTNWDEIPQLINVLLGHMSLVGPRPERPIYVQQFQQNIPRYMERHREKAGMTGWAQVNGLRGDTSIAQRTTYDLWYVENWSLWLDIKIIIRTVWQTLTRSAPNAY
jgi:exopolysaccharide biosynthesis polyprenyl glycosylphosphotransferase